MIEGHFWKGSFLIPFNLETEHRISQPPTLLIIVVVTLVVDATLSRSPAYIYVALQGVINKIILHT